MTFGSNRKIGLTLENISFKGVGPKAVAPSSLYKLSTWTLVTAIKVSGPAAPCGSGGVNPVFWEKIVILESMHASIRVARAWHGVKLETPAKSGDDSSWGFSFWLEVAGKDSVVTSCVKLAFAQHKVERREAHES